MFEQLVAFKAQSGGSATTLKSWGPPEEIKKPDVEQRAGGRSMLFLVGSKTGRTRRNQSFNSCCS